MSTRRLQPGPRRGRRPQEPLPAGRVGDVEVKEKLAAALNAFLDPMRERRARYEADQGLVDELIVTGTERTRRVVQQTVFEARNAMGLTGVYTQLRRKAERSRRPAPTTA